MLNPSMSICLKGFPKDQGNEAAEMLTTRGIRVVQTLTAAQMIVAGPEASRNLFQIAQESGIPLLSWDDYCKTHLTEVQDRRDAPRRTPEPAAAPEVLPLMERGNGWVRILDVFLDLPGPERSLAQFSGLIPRADRFTQICVDQGFADTLRAVSTGARHDFPVAIEGETSSSKTTAVLWLAHQLGHPVVRLNLNSQTDAGELIGRYVPGSGAGGLDLATLVSHAHLFSEPTQAILRAATQAGRALTQLEILTLAGRENLPLAQWRFQEGWLLKALRHGHWLLLDEINLAEPQVLERLNSVLETPRSLVLTEGDGTIFGPGGDLPIDPAFRLFATSNPAEYAGRSVLSPAFRDRWTVWHQASSATEADYLALLQFLFFGRQPVISCRGRFYQAEHGVPPLAHLEELPDAKSVVRSLAMFQAAVVKASGLDGSPPSLGRGRRERYSFSRRTLLTTLQQIDRQIACGATPKASLVREAVEFFYINRLRSTGDRNSLLSLLRAAGL